MIVMCEIQLRLAAEAWIRTGFSPLGRTVGNSWKYLVVRKLPAWKLLGRYPDDQRAEYADNWLGSDFRYFFASCTADGFVTVAPPKSPRFFWISTRRRQAIHQG
jgi:hypothetical protein